MRTLPNVASFASVVVLLGAMASCNGMLGIEEAELDPSVGGAEMGGSTSTGGSSSGGTSNGGTSSGGTSSGGTSSTQTTAPVTDPPAVGCVDPGPHCAECLSSCGAFDKNACLANPTCRKALDSYRSCLGDGCTGGEGCRERLSAIADADVERLVGCLSTDFCVSNCGSSPVVTMCELYCACMADNCSAQFASPSECLTKCQAAGRSDLTYCQKMHCEFLELPNTDATVHCEHAMGIGQCTAPIVVPPGDCKMAYPGFPCKVATDCCSMDCSNQVCR